MLKTRVLQGFLPHNLLIDNHKHPPNTQYSWVLSWVPEADFHQRALDTQMPLSDLQIRKAKQRDKPYRMGDGLGLYLTVKPSGSKLWHFRYQFMGREKILSMGTYPILSLADARAKRDEAKRQLANDVDPSVQKKLDQIDAVVKARMTFKEIADEYYENLVDRGLAASTLRKKRWHIDDLAKQLHEQPIDQITAAELLYLLKPIERSGRRETAKKLRATISAVFRLAMVTMRAPADPSAASERCSFTPKSQRACSHH